MSIKQELKTLKNLGFRETTPLTYVYIDMGRGNLFMQYDKNTLQRKSWATTLAGSEADKTQFPEYSLFKIRMEKLKGEQKSI